MSREGRRGGGDHPKRRPGTGEHGDTHTYKQAPLVALKLMRNMQTAGGAANWTSIMRGSRSRRSSNRRSKNTVSMIIRLQRELNVQPGPSGSGAGEPAVVSELS